MKRLWDFSKNLLIALAIAYSYKNQFSFGDLFGISNAKVSWFVNIATHTFILNVMFFVGEWLIEKNKVHIISSIYVDKDFKDDSNYILLDKKNPKSVFWKIKIDGKRYLLPQYITLSYSEDIVVQINKNRKKYILVNDEKKQIKIRLRGCIQKQNNLDNEERIFKLSIINNTYQDNIGHGIDSKLTPFCVQCPPFINTTMKSLKVKVKGE